MNEPKVNEANSPALIAAVRVGKSFGLRPALRDVSFSIFGGTVAAVLGPNGSGKTTLFRMIAGLSKPSAGSLSVGGWRLPAEVDHVRAQIGVVSHQPLLYDDLSAEENLRFFGRLYDVHEPEAQIAALLERVGLAKRANELVRTFSRGMQQRLAIARAVVHQPAVLLFDEPYTGLDVNGAAMLDSMITEWKADQRTILISLHELPRAAQIADQVIILSRGRVVYDAAAHQTDDLSAVYASVTA